MTTTELIKLAAEHAKLTNAYLYGPSSVRERLSEIETIAHDADVYDSLRYLSYDFQSGVLKEDQ